MKSSLIILVMIICISFFVMAHAEPPVVALDHTSIRMEMIYDPHRQIYFIPR